jgi:hypothetical protein
MGHAELTVAIRAFGRFTPEMVLGSVSAVIVVLTRAGDTTAAVRLVSQWKRRLFSQQWSSLQHEKMPTGFCGREAARTGVGL